MASFVARRPSYRRDVARRLFDFVIGAIAGELRLAEYWCIIILPERTGRSLVRLGGREESPGTTGRGGG